MKRHLLLVDADPQSRRILEVSLRKAGYAVTGVGDATAALDRMAATRPDLVLSDTRLPGRDGFALVTAIRQRPAWSAVPVMFLSSDASVESKTRGLQQGVDEYLVKPIYIHEVVARVNLVLQRSERQQLERGDAAEKTRFTGSLEQLGLVDAIRTMDKGRHSGVLHAVSGKERAALYFRDGALIDAEAGALRGKRAMERALSWSEGTFEGEFREVRREDAIRTPIQALLADSMRRIDDWSRIVEALPPLDHVLEVDVARLGTRLDDVPDEANAILRSFDGRRSIQQAIDEGGAGDIGRLRMILKLWSDGLLADRSDGGAHAPASSAAASLALATATPSDGGDVQPRTQRTTEDFEAPVSKRKKRTTLDYDDPPPPPHEREDAQATTPGTLDAGELLAATTPGSLSAPEHADRASGADDADDADDGGAADSDDEPREGDGAAPRTSLARMRRRRRRWKRLSLEGAPPPPTATVALTPVDVPAPKIVRPAAAATTAATPEPATTAEVPARMAMAAPPITPPATPATTAQPMPAAIGTPGATSASPPTATTTVATSATPRPSSALLDVAQPRTSAAPPPVRSPFSLVPPAADMAARLEVARTRRSLPPAAPPEPPGHAAKPGIAPPTSAPPTLATAVIPAGAFTPRTPVVTRPEELGKTRIADSATTTQPLLAPPPVGSPTRTAQGATTVMTQAWGEPASPVAPAHTSEPSVTTSPELPRVRAQSGAASVPTSGAATQLDHQVGATPTAAGAPTRPIDQVAASAATATSTQVAPSPAHRANPPDRQSAWDIPQDEEPITVPPPPSSQRVLAWGALVGACLVAAALVYRLVVSGSDGAHATTRQAPAAEAPPDTEAPPAIVAPPTPTGTVAPAPTANAPTAPPVPAEAAPPAAVAADGPAPAPVAPAAAVADAPGQAAPPAAEVEPTEPAAAPAATEPVAAPAAPDAAAQRDLLVAQARALEAKGKPVKALSLYEQAVQLDPNASAILSHLALAYLNAGRYKDALERAERAVTADATNSEGWIVLGAARDGRNDHKGAREAYRRCSEVGTGAYVIECRRMLR